MCFRNSKSRDTDREDMDDARKGGMRNLQPQVQRDGPLRPSMQQPSQVPSQAGDPYGPRGEQPMNGYQDERFNGYRGSTLQQPSNPQQQQRTLQNQRSLDPLQGYLPPPSQPSMSQQSLMPGQALDFCTATIEMLRAAQVNKTDKVSEDLSTSVQTLKEMLIKFQSDTSLQLAKLKGDNKYLNQQIDQLKNTIEDGCCEHH